MVRGRSRRENRHVPLYHQVEQVIRYWISSGRYAPGSQIPSEHELGRELEVSRVTVREALRELVQDNLLVKVQGKGTFVAQLPKGTLSLPARIIPGLAPQALVLPVGGVDAPVTALRVSYNIRREAP